MRRSEPARYRPRTSSLWVLAAAVLLSQLSFGSFLNDEAGQLQGLHNLVRGDLGGEARSPHFYAVFEGVLLPEWDVQSTVGSGFVDFASVPAYFLFKLLDPVASAPVLLLLAWAATTYLAVLRGVPRLAAWRGRSWSWRSPDPDATGLRAMTPAHAGLVAALVAVVAWGWATLPRLDFGLWGEVFAVQATNVALGATGFALFWRVVERHAGRRAAGLAFAALLVGPALFWSSGIKYHGPSVFLVVLGLWLYGRPDRWRWAAFPVAVLGAWNTVLAVPFLVALVGVEAVRLVREALGQRRGPALLALAGAVVAGGAAVGGVMAYNLAVWGSWTGRVGAPDGGAWAWLRHQVRFESAATSLLNVLRVFVHAHGVEGYPVAVLALTPLVVLGLVAVAAMVRNPTRGDPVLWAAAAGNVLFFLLMVHGSQTQGSGMDHRFWLITLPGWLLLAARLLAPRLDALDAAVFWRAGRVLAVVLGLALLLLGVLGASGVALDEANPVRQVLWAADAFGTVAWVSLLALWLRHDALLASEGRHRVERRWGTVLGLCFVAPVLWLVMASLVIHREIPPWPFFSGADGLSFLLPGLERFMDWWSPRLLP